MLHPDPAVTPGAAYGGPPGPLTSAPLCPSGSHQAECPACSALSLSLVPCQAQPRGHPVPWQCGLAELMQFLSILQG